MPKFPLVDISNQGVEVCINLRLAIPYIICRLSGHKDTLDSLKILNSDSLLHQGKFFDTTVMENPTFSILSY